MEPLLRLHHQEIIAASFKEIPVADNTQNMDLEKLAEKRTQKELQKIICNLLASYLSPAFGAFPKREIDLMFLNALQEMGAIAINPSLYELISELKITRSKARTLYYDRELRRLDKEDLDKKAVEVLKNPVLQRQGELFVLEIENPLVSDHIRYMFQKIGYATDGSFSPSLVKVSLDAFVKLLDAHLSEESKNNIKKALVKAGAPDKSFKGIVKGALGTLGKKIASEAGEAFAENISDYIGPLWDASSQKVYDSFAELFKGISKDKRGSEEKV